MFTREEASRIRQEFWTTLGKYLSPVPSAEGYKVNWINYHTQVKDVYFRMLATNKMAVIAISIEHHDAGVRELFFDQFLELQFIFQEYLNEEWIWSRLATDENGRPVSRISRALYDVSLFDRNNWPELISFFKPRIIALDAFWQDARYSFDSLR